MINKAVVGFGHGDAPKYTGEGVALHGTPGALGVLLPWCSCLCTAILGNFVMSVLWTQHIQSTSSYCQCYIIKGCCDIICDVTALHMHWSCDLLL